jgi:hypothetical protein
MSSLDEAGCVAVVWLDASTDAPTPGVGSDGGYGGFYCFALTP